MQAEQIKLVQSTIPVLREHGVALTQHFYQRMLSHHPELKNVFNMDHQNTGRQPRALAAAVLAYAEHIENPSVLAKAVERITTKHVSLGILPEQYSIVGENLLHSISEVLNVPMDSELIAAWKAAYMQLADLLIQTEQGKYQQLEATIGGWSGWRDFRIVAREINAEGVLLSLQPVDAQPIAAAHVPAFISLRVQMNDQPYKQPQQFQLIGDASTQQYCIQVSTNLNDQVSQQLCNSIDLGSIVEVSAPLAS